jgi:hypothetical protein
VSAVTDVAIVANGGANIASLRFALDRLGISSHLTTDPAELRSASRVILPGVGAAGDAMQRLHALGLADVIPALTQPVLGICLGMQLLFAGSDEDDTSCLGIIPARVTRLPPRPGFPVPHMGWNQLHVRAESALTSGGLVTITSTSCTVSPRPSVRGRWPPPTTAASSRPSSSNGTSTVRNFIRNAHPVPARDCSRIS